MVFQKYENSSVQNFDYLFCATNFISERFKKIKENVITINNFPIIDELFQFSDKKTKTQSVCYTGGIGKIRCINEIIDALDYTEIHLNLAGNFESPKLEEEIKKHKNFNKVKYYGFLDRNQMKDLINESQAGLVLFYPVGNHINAQPNKLFEYMSAGLPVICSDFELWKEIIEKNNCGICVNPLSPAEIAKAINYIVENKQIAEQMGINGRNAAISLFDWKNEFSKILNIYNKLTE